MRRLFILFYRYAFVLHGVAFLKSANKQLIIADLYSSGKKENGKVFYDLLEKLASDKYFRTLFYFRTKGPLSNLLRIVFPKERRLIIDINTKLGGGVVLAHPYGTIINAESIGDNLYINQLVTVGESNGKRPKIGDNVKLYTNATIIGGVTIGNNVVVGAGTVVVKDVPSDCIIAGNPARIIRYIR